MTHKRLQIIFDSLAVSVGTFFFLWFLFLCFVRTLGPPNTAPVGTAVLAVLFGAAAVVAGAFFRANGPPESRRFALAAIVEGVALVVLTMICWALMGPS